MKRYRLLLIFVIFLIPFYKVEAASVSVCNSSGYHSDLKGSSGCSSSISAITGNDSYVYEIQSVNFTKTEIKVGGFALLRDVNNGDKKNNNDNYYWLIAQSKNGETYVSGSVKGGGGSGTGLSDLDYSTFKKAGDGTLLCNKGKTIKGQYEYLLNTHNVYRVQGKKRNDTNKNSNSEWIGCLSESMSSKEKKIYHDIEFNLKINLQEIEKYFEKDTEISLKLLMKNSSNNKYYLTDIYTYKDDIKVSNDANSVVKDVGSTNIVGSTVRFVAKDAYIRNSDNRIMKYPIIKNKVNNNANNDPAYGKFYSATSSSDTNGQYVVTDVFTNFKPRLYGLKVSNSTKNVVADTPIFNKCTGNSCTIGYAYSIWIRVNGKTTFKLAKGKSVDCESEICIGSNCKNSYEVSNGLCPIKNDPMMVSTTSKAITISACQSDSGTPLVNQIVEKKTLYYKIPNYKIVMNEQIIDNVRIVGNTYKLNSNTVRGYDDNGDGVNDGALIPITFISKFNYVQNYSFIIDNSFKNGMEVEVRRGFPFKFNYDIVYSRSIVSSNIGNDLKNSYTTVNNSYSKTISKVSIYDDSIGGYKEVDLNVRLTGDDYLYDSSGKNGLKYKDIYNTSVFNDKSSINSLGNVSLEFPDSSNVNNQNFVTNEQFVCSLNSLGNGYSCSYDLPVAYWKNDSNVYPVIKYGSSYKNNSNYHVLNETKNLYYVPYNYPLGTRFSFYVKADDLGIVDGLSINLDITCSVNVSSFDIMDEDNLIYRTIDVSNPFPKGNMGDNWKKYSKLDSDFRRIKNTFSCINNSNCISYKTDVFSNLDRAAISNISSSGLGRYSSISDIDIATGNSKVISNIDDNGEPLFTINGKSSLFIINNGNHNSYGQFDINKDKAQGT